MRRSVGQRQPPITLEYVMDEISRRGSPKVVAGMARFAIEPGTAFGVSIPQLRYLAKKVGTDHELAQELWKTGIHEARILASMIDDPTKVSEAQMEGWAADFDSWDVVDGCCGNLLIRRNLQTEKQTNGPPEKRSSSREQALSLSLNWPFTTKRLRTKHF